MSSEDGTSVVAILAMPRLYPLDVTIPAHGFGRYLGYRVASAVRRPVPADRAHRPPTAW